MVFVVAEIGVNWDGEPVLAEEMMRAAKNSGCNAVKFQAFNEEIVKNNLQKNQLIRSTISKSNIEFIDGLAKSVGIEWFCTPMYKEAVDLLDPYVKRFKIRATDSESLLKNTPTEMVEKLLKNGKQLIISTQLSPKKTKYYRNSNIKWLYTVSKYPCSLSDLDFSNLRDFDGYSNHCPHFLAPLIATILGSEIIEIHITSDKSKNFIDNPVSFDYFELNTLVSLMRMSEKVPK